MSRPAFISSAVVGAALACLPASAAPGVACGTTLYGPVTLTADVVCPAGVDGLIIGDHKVRIELNGFSIVGPFTAAAPTLPAIGIRSSGYWGVQIVGPGEIVGFKRLIDIEGGGNHLVSGIRAMADSGMSVSLRNGSGSLVETSRLSSVEIVSRRGGRATANRIIGNDVGPDPGMPAGGIDLLGCDTADNVVAANSIDPHDRDAVVLDNGAHSNQILKNKIVGGEIYLHGASNNLIEGNMIRNTGVYGYAGVQIESSDVPVACAGGVVLPGSKNIVRGNGVRGGGFGALIDDTTLSVWSSGNQVTGNTFIDQTHAGLVFGYGAIDNDGRGNTYVGVAPPVYDFPMRNLWP
jgi:hypothetical protein